MTKILISILSLAVAGAVFFVYTKPTFNALQDLKVRVGEYDAGLQKSRELQELRSALLARYNTFPSGDLERLARLLPDHVDNVRLVLDLDSMATRYGMAVQNVVIANVKSAEQTVIGVASDQQKKYEPITLQFSTRATYPNFVRFMEDIESSLRIVDLVSLSIDSEPLAQVSGAAESFAAEPTYKYNIVIRTYWLK